TLNCNGFSHRRPETREFFLQPIRYQINRYRVEVEDFETALQLLRQILDGAIRGADDHRPAWEAVKIRPQLLERSRAGCVNLVDYLHSHPKHRRELAVELPLADAVHRAGL